MKNILVKTLFLSLMISGVLLLGACSPEGGDKGYQLAESSWNLISMPGFADLGDVNVTLNFDAEGAIGGNGGCNTYGGSYEIFEVEASIKFSEIFSTEMFCEENDASMIESAFFTALGEAQSYTQTFESLRIQGPGGTMEFGVAP